MDSRLLAVGLVLCLGVVGGAVGVAGVGDSGVSLNAAQETPENQTMTVVAAENTSDYLAPAPGAIDRAGHGTPSLDVASAVNAQSGELRASFQQATLQRRYENASTPEERRAVIRNGTDRVSTRIDRVERDHETALRQYATGDLRTVDFYRTLAAVHQEATALEPTVIWLEEKATELGLSEARAQLATDRARVAALHGPVRASIQRSIEGEDPQRVHVTIADRGVVLATITEADGGPVYVREAYNPDASTTQPDQYEGDLQRSLDRFEALYPWLETNAGGLTVAPVGAGAARSYRWRVTYEHGMTETYLDGGSGQIFYEVQRVDPAALPTTSTSTTTDAGAGLRLEVTHTRGGGPLGVRLVETATDTPVAATVTLNGEPLGSTDGDRLWTVQPRGQVTVTATHDGTTISLDGTNGTADGPVT